MPAGWFDRASRFVRLARWTGLSFPDLDLVLRDLCGNVLDRAALRVVAAVTHLAALHDLPVDVVCSLVAPMSTLGIGDDDVPQDLFDRTFNGQMAAIERQVILGSPFVPAAYRDAQVLTCSGDLLAPRNDAFRRRVALALGRSETELAAIVARFRASDLRFRGDGPFDGDIGVGALSLLHRVSTLARAVEVSLPELFGILDALRTDPELRAGNSFDLFLDLPTDLPADLPTAPDPYRVLVGSAAADGLWLVQLVGAVARWMADTDLDSTELRRVLGGAAAPPAGSADLAAEIATFDGLYQQFQGVLLTAGQLVSARLGERAARVVHRFVTAPGGPVCDRDRRLVRLDEATAARATHAALADLGVITADDLAGLAAAERLRQKIFANLVFRGYLRADGTLVEEAFPRRAEDLVLAGDFGAYREQLYTVIGQLRLDEAEHPADLAEPAAEGEPVEA